MKEIIHQILALIKHDQNYIEAAKLCKQHGLNLQKITDMTFKFTNIELARLADAIKQTK